MPARALLIGEAPGAQEDKKNKVFYGKTGQEVDNTYLPLAGLARNATSYNQSVRITNAIKCLPVSSGGKLDPKSVKDQALLESCAGLHLYEELMETQAEVVVPMGNFANRAIDPEVNLELHHGIPLQTAWGLTMPMYHPALGMHEPKKMLLIRNDWITLGKVLRKAYIRVKDEYPNPDYSEFESTAEIDDYLDGAWELPLGCDTETTRDGDPFCMTVSAYPGTGRLIRAEREDLIQKIQFHINRWEGKILWHNWNFDKAVTNKMGLKFPHKKIVDTMVRVFHLGNLPQGLKALAFRELGMQMQDFDDLVSPHSSKLVLEYYEACREVTWPKPPEQEIRQEDGSFKTYRPQSFNTKLKRFFTDYSKNPQKDIFNMWRENWESLHDEVETQMGRWPGKCISHAPFDEVLYYSARDSDTLVRLYPKIKRMIARMRHGPQERWAA